MTNSGTNAGCLVSDCSKDGIDPDVLLDAQACCERYNLTFYGKNGAGVYAFDFNFAPKHGVDICLGPGERFGDIVALSIAAFEKQENTP